MGAARGVLDISLSAAVDGALVVYWSFPGRSFSPGFHLIGGTSEATPLLAGLVAIADQIKGSRVGLINPALYNMAGRSVDNGISNITIGDNDFTYVDSQQGVVTVTGFEAGRDYNPAAGLGTVDANRFCCALAAQAPG